MTKTASYTVLQVQENNEIEGTDWNNTLYHKPGEYEI